MMEYLQSWLPWLGLGGVALGGLGWFLGAGVVLSLLAQFMRIAASIVEVLVPLFRAALDGVIWLWQSVFWPGLKDILDDWVTVATVVAMGAILYLALTAQSEVRYRYKSQELVTCQLALKAARRPLPPPGRVPELNLWPWSW